MSEPPQDPEPADPAAALTELRSALQAVHLRALAAADQQAASVADDALLSQRLARAGALSRTQRERLAQAAAARLDAHARAPDPRAHLERLVARVREALERARAQGALDEATGWSESLAELEALVRERVGEGTAGAEPAPAPAARDEPAPPSPPLVRARPKVGRNDPCPCGSGRKHKRCCQTARA